MAKKPVIYDDDAPELTEAELAEFRPAREAMSDEQFEAVSSVRRGRPKAADPKLPVTIRLSRSVLEAYKATGPGWQTRMNDTLVGVVNYAKHNALDDLPGEKSEVERALGDVTRLLGTGSR